MQRRKFLRRVGAAAGMAPVLMSGIPVQAFAASSPMRFLAANATNDNILVILQLHGGNDGLNMVVPVSQYSEYYNIRPNIALPESGNRRYLMLDNTLPDDQKVGLHPDMIGAKDLYDQGKVAIVQGVSYENSNGSHFRGRDIWFMGGGSNDYYGSGWLGRYLNGTYPGYPDGPPNSYPNNEMPDPPGIEIGRGVSIAFHRENGIPAGLAVQNPQQFYDLINSVGGAPPVEIVDSHYGDELRYIMDIEKQSNQYAGRLKEVFERGKNSSGVVYPTTYPLTSSKALNNVLSGQLKLIARLISGGIKSRVFLARIGGFDTHAQQVEDYDPTVGHHAALLYHISSAVKAFYDDLQQQGLDQKVLSCTYSEFGRRAVSNGSYGTDHGTAAPMMLFGRGVNPGVYGSNPDLGNLVRGNIPMQYDYRHVLTSVVKDWLEAPEEVIMATKFGDFLDDRLPVSTAQVTSSRSDFFSERFRLHECYPNPAKSDTRVVFYINRNMHVKLRLFDLQGREVMVLVDEPRSIGEHEVKLNVQHLKAGMYFYRLEAGKWSASRKLSVVD